MKQIPKYEYFLLQIKKHAYYLEDTVNELASQMATMALQGWQAKGPHQVTVLQDQIIITQMLKRFHPEYMKTADMEHSLMYDKEEVANLPIVVE